MVDHTGVGLFFRQGHNVMSADHMSAQLKWSCMCSKTGAHECTTPVWSLMWTNRSKKAQYSERARASTRFRAWGTAPQKILNLRRRGAPKFLICAVLFLLLKDPDTQMACNTPKMWPHFGCNKHQGSGLRRGLGNAGKLCRCF